MNSQEYWKKRETEAKRHNIQDEEEYNRQIQEIYENMLDQINKEINGFYARYAKKEKITMAEAKGMSFGMIVRRHILRNSILPSLTILGPNVADVFTGSFIIESIFSIPGLGSYYITSVTDRDFPMIIGSTMFYTGVYILSLLIVDILYVIIDPRIRLAGND